MDRSQSEDHIAFGPVTPWERSTFSHQPRRTDSAPGVPVREMSRSSRSKSTVGPGPATRSLTLRSNGSRHRGTPPPEESMRRQQSQGSYSNQPTPLPYETPFHVPAPSRNTASPPPLYTNALPALSPESFDGKSSESTDKSMSPSSQVVNTLPGTMSARTSRSKSSAKQRSEKRASKKAAKTGWKVVFKQMFTRTPVDESQFEAIEDRHWTDD